MDSRVTLISAVARLLDLHQTQHPRGTSVAAIIAPKQPPPSAGFFLSLGLAVVDALHNLELERGSGFQSKSKVVEYVKIRLPQATDNDLEFCIRFLSLNREVNFLVENEKNEEVTTRISDTALIEKAGEFSQIRLTETARLLLRIDAAQESWLYKDKDVEKIAVAVERGHFHDISRFCREIIISLSGLGLRLTQLEERPTMVEKRQEFAGLHLFYGETISRAQQAIARAIALTTMEPVRERFKTWAEQNGIEDAEMGFVLNDLEHVQELSKPSTAS